MRKVILYIAETLDGYIADDLDGFSFLNEYDDLDAIKESYMKLTHRIDTIIMGKKTYEVIKQMGSWPYEGYMSYIISSKIHQTEDKSIKFMNDIKSLITNLKKEDGKDIWLVGGGILIESFIKNGWIDEYMIAVIPKLIGRGKRLFNPIDNYEKLKLVHMEQMDEIVMLTYHKIT